MRLAPFIESWSFWGGEGVKREEKKDKVSVPPRSARTLLPTDVASGSPSNSGASQMWDLPGVVPCNEMPHRPWHSTSASRRVIEKNQMRLDHTSRKSSESEPRERSRVLTLTVVAAYLTFSPGQQRRNGNRAASRTICPHLRWRKTNSRTVVVLSQWR